MRFQVTFKDPDSLHDAIADAVAEEISALPITERDERDSLTSLRSEKTYDFCKRWFKWGEYVTLEIDTDAKTCTVVEQK